MSLDSPLIRPFAGLRPRRSDAAAVAAPPYDVLSSDEARQAAIGKPLSFLHVSKAEIDLPRAVDHYAPEVYAKTAENFQRMIQLGVLQRDQRPSYYAYRMIMDEHVQTGLVAAASVAAYESNRIRKHEYTRPDKEDDRVRQIEALNAQTGPVLLAHTDDAQAEALLAQATAGLPDTDVLTDAGVRHLLWCIDDDRTIAQLSQVYNRMPTLYIADGHHRSAAAARVAAARRPPATTAATTGGSAEFFLSVIFPARQMRILDYNRVVRDLNGYSEAEFLAAVARCCSVQPCTEPCRPDRPTVCGMYLNGRWYRLEFPAAWLASADPVHSLDVSLLAENILGPVLGIGDLRRDTRIDFVGGGRGLAELERRVDSAEMAVAFAMCPTPMAALMRVADAGQVMPPKSTWFDPKLADGLVSHVLD